MSKKYWRHFRIFVISMFVIIVGIWSLLWVFLSSYEKGRTMYTAEKIVGLYNNKKYKELSLYTENDDINSKVSIEKFLEHQDYKNVSYEKKVGTYTTDNPVYSIMCNNSEIAVLQLEKDENTGLFNIARWKVKSLTIPIENKETIIVVPKNVSVIVNGTELSKDYITDDNYYPNHITNVLKYTSFEPCNKYVIKRLYESSKVSLSYGKLVKKDNVYMYDFGSNEELLNDLGDYIKKICYAYNRYVSNEHSFYALTPYLLTTTPTYNFLRGVSNTNIWSKNHTPTQFSEIKLSNMQVYSPELFSIDAHYDYYYYVNTTKREYTADITLLMIKKNGKWLVADLTT